MNGEYQTQLRDTQAEMLMHPMLTRRLSNAEYDQRFMHSIQFYPTLVEDEDYYNELQAIEHLAIMKQQDDKFVSAFIRAKNDPDSVFYSKQPLTRETIAKIDKAKYEELMMKRDISTQSQMLRNSVAYNFYQLQHLPQLEAVNDPILRLINTKKRALPAIATSDWTKQADGHKSARKSSFRCKLHNSV